MLEYRIAQAITENFTHTNISVNFIARSAPLESSMTYDLGSTDNSYEEDRSESSDGIFSGGLMRDGRRGSKIDGQDEDVVDSAPESPTDPDRYTQPKNAKRKMLYVKLPSKNTWVPDAPSRPAPDNRKERQMANSTNSSNTRPEKNPPSVRRISDLKSAEIDVARSKQLDLINESFIIVERPTSPNRRDVRSGNATNALPGSTNVAHHKRLKEIKIINPRVQRDELATAPRTSHGGAGLLRPGSLHSSPMARVVVRNAPNENKEFIKLAKKRDLAEEPVDSADDVIVLDSSVPAAFDCDRKEATDPRSASLLTNIDKIRESVATIMSNAHERRSVMIENTAALRNAHLKQELRSQEATAQTTDGPAYKVISSQSNIGSAAGTPSGEAERSSFFQDFLGLSGGIPPGARRIPDSFASYGEYYALFNTLRLHEIRSSVVMNLMEKERTEKCEVVAIEPCIEVKVKSRVFVEYDLVLVGKHPFGKTLHRLVQSFRSGTLYTESRECFIGYVEEVVYDKKGKQGSQEGTIVRIITGGQKPLIRVSDILSCRVVENLTTWLREFYALKAFKDCQLLSGILNPTELSAEEPSAIVAAAPVSKRWETKAPTSLITNMYAQTARAPLETPSELPKTLNSSQQNVVEQCIRSRAKISLVQGPPGTGKTRVVLAIIQALARRSNDKILVCAPSNTAVDEIMLRLVAEKDRCPEFIRIGSTNSKALENYVLDSQIDSLFATGTNKFDRAGTRQWILSRTKIVCSTLSSCAAGYTNGMSISYLIVDEACQATELAMLVPLKYNPQKIIMIGDPRQLPPTVFSQNRVLERSLFERLSRFIKPAFLNTQYRMLSPICQLSSVHFYSGRLISAEHLGVPAARHGADSLTLGNGVRGANKCRFDATTFIHIDNGGEAADKSKSYYNAEEAKTAVLIQKLLKKRYKALHIAIISPYRAQKTYISSLPGCLCEVSTIDAFQGREADAIILSTVRSNGLGFVCDFRRINVAITRAKYGVFILGNRNCLEKNDTWKSIISVLDGDKHCYNRKNLSMLIKRL